MRCEYIVTREDYGYALKAWHRASRRAASSYYFWVWIVPAVFLIASALWIFEIHADLLDMSMTTVMGLSTLIGIAIGLPVRYAKGIRRSYDQRMALAKNNPIYFEFDEVTARFIIPNGAEVSYPWNSFTGYADGEHVAVFFVAEAVFHTVPKRAMDESSWTVVRRLMGHARMIEC